MMVSHGLYGTLWMLSCFGLFLSEDLQFSGPANGAVGGSVVFAPNNPPSTSVNETQWYFGTTLILIAQSDSTVIASEYRGRVSFDRNTLALELWNQRLDDSGIYRLTVETITGDKLTGETSLQVFEIITNVRFIGPEEPLIEGESSANIIGGRGGGGLSSGAIAGIVIGVLVAVAGICGLIFYLTKTKKISKINLRQNGPARGAAQSRQEPDLNYADISHFQKASGERVNLGNKSEFSTEYAEVKHGGKSRAPPPPYGSQEVIWLVSFITCFCNFSSHVSNPPPVRRDLQLLLSPQEGGGHA
ncbi:uncharacterized protein LOC107756203 [Sinocyclocheilus rhinocerous]|uniref:uncharacterized protein LOC107756203 n=1 Tax=Sinocyclocheilus rhinocerous TaxID=307959 RepID=UPI0007B8E3D7|nr:PREDICTED: uncharacterized protein LOC107756203 [Sinocyclocheilus rhinocerous]